MKNRIQLILTLLLIPMLPAFAQWEPTGGPTGGSVYSLLVHGEYVYAGTSNGLNISQNNGDKWDFMGKGLENLDILSIEPFGTSLYVSTRKDYTHKGIFRSQDNGVTWNRIDNNLPEDSPIMDMHFTPAGWYVINNQGVYRSTDNGINWKPIYLGSVYSILTLGNTVFIGHGGTGYENLSQQYLYHEPGIYKLELQPDIDYTNDDWNKIGESINEGIYSLAGSEQTVYAGTYDGYYMSTDAGANWSGKIPTGYVGRIDKIKINAPYIYILSYSQVYQKKEGTDWINVTGVSSEPIYANTFEVGGSNIYVGDYEGIVRSNEQTIDWVPINEGLISSSVSSLLPFDGKLFTSGSFSQKFASVWTKNGIPLSGITKFKEMYFAGAEEYDYAPNLYTSSDGLTWNQVETKWYDLNSQELYIDHIRQLLSTSSGSGMYALAEGGLFIANNEAGTEWQEIFNREYIEDLSMEGYAYPENISAAYLSSDRILISTERGIFISDNNIDWQLPYSFEGGTQHYIAKFIAEGNTIYAVTGDWSNIVLVSIDNGNTWTPKTFNNFLSGSEVILTDLYFAKGTLFAATNTGIFASKNNGTTWESFNQGLAESNWNLSAITGLNNNIYIGTGLSGVFYRPIAQFFPPTVITGASSAVTANTATLSGTASANGYSTTATVKYGKDKSSLTESRLATPNSLDGNSIAVNVALTSLEPATTYYYQFHATNEGGSAEGEIKEFKTLPPTVGMEDAKEVTATTAKITGKVSAFGYELKLQIKYGINQQNLDKQVAATPASTTGDDVQIAASLENLEPGTIYFYQLTGTKVEGNLLVAGEIKSFTTLPQKVETLVATEVMASSAKMNGKAFAYLSALTLHFEYGINIQNLDQRADGSPSATTGNDITIIQTLAGLNPNTTYHYRLVGVRTKDNMRIVGEIKSFTTGAPSVVAEPATEITTNTAKLNGKVTTQGAAVAVFFEYGIDKLKLDKASAIQQPVTGINTAFNVSLTNLEPGVTYFFRPVATIGAIRTEGDILEFKTNPIIVVARQVTNLKSATATLGGQASAFGYQTEVFFEYGTNALLLDKRTNPQLITENDKSISADIAELEPNTLYFYRMVANKKQGVNYQKTGDQILEFTTAPHQVETGETTKITAYAASVSGTVSAYNYTTELHFKYGLNKQDLTSTAEAIPGSTKENNKQVVAELNNLEPGETYYYHLVGKKTQGNQNQVEGAILSFQTEEIISKEKIASTSSFPEVIKKNKDGYAKDTISLSFSGKYEGTRVNLYTRSIIKNELIGPIPVKHTGTSYEINLPTDKFDQLGLAYYLEVIPPQGYGKPFTTQTYYASIHYENGLDFPFEIAKSKQQEDYQMIAFPLISESSSSTYTYIVENFLGAYEPSKWRMFTYSGDPNKPWRELVNKQEINPGSSYWILANEFKSAKLNTGPGKTVINTETFQDSVYVIKLAKGWNQIGNPYPFDVTIDNILQASQIATGKLEFYTYNKDWTEPKDVKELQAFRGAMVHSEEEGLELKIPARDIRANGGRLAAEDAEEFNANATLDVPFALLQNSRSYTLAALGMHPEAKQGRDRFDQILLPRLANSMDIGFAHPEHFSNYFSKDIVPTSENHIWNFTINTDAKEDNLQLTWLVGQKDATKELWLHDLSNDRITNMQDRLAYTFQASKGREFKVYYGERRFIAENLKPTQGRLATAYPNPFAYTTTIPFTIPDSQLPYQVRISVYDLKGVELAVLTEQEYLTGFHELAWDGRGRNGGRLQPGMYLVKAQLTGNKESKVFFHKLIIE